MSRTIYTGSLLQKLSMETLSKIAHDRLYPSLTDPNFFPFAPVAYLLLLGIGILRQVAHHP